MNIMSTLKHIRRNALGLMAAALIAATSFAQSKPFPSEAFTVTVPFGAGGGTDLVARRIGKAITDKTSQPVIIENRPGANGIIGTQHAKGMSANGYNILLTTSTTHGANPSLYKSLPYDPVKDFEPIGSIGVGGVVMMVGADSKVKNLHDFLESAKASKNPLTFGSGNSSSQVGAELLKAATGVNLLNVPYKSVPAALTDLVGGQVDVVFADSIAAQPMIRSGRVKAIGVSTKSRIPGLQEVPTIAEQGVKDYEFLGWIAAYTPKGVPEDRRNYLNNLLNDILKEKSMVEFLNDNGWIVQSGSMSDLEKFQRNEMAKWKQIVDATGMIVQ